MRCLRLPSSRSPTQFDITALSSGPELFAVANGMSYHPSAQPAGFGGALFDYLQQPACTEVFRATGAWQFESGRGAG